MVLRQHSTGDAISPPNDLKAARDVVGHTMNTVAFMCDEGVVDVAQIVANWGVSIHRAWVDCEEYVVERREKEDNPRLWSSFERLGKATPTLPAGRFRRTMLRRKYGAIICKEEPTCTE